MWKGDLTLYLIQQNSRKQTTTKIRRSMPQIPCDTLVENPGIEKPFGFFAILEPDRKNIWRIMVAFPQLKWILWTHKKD